MNENIKTIFVSIGLLIIFTFIMGCAFISAIEILEYSNYKYYQEEGYQVRFEWFEDGCEMKLNNIDGTQGWRSCSPGDEHTIENYGVKTNE